MKRTFVILVLIAAMAGAAWYARSSGRNSPPRISVTSPAGGEKWLSGEEHRITWSTANVPATHKISVSIRRVPPPPLQEEGQEFDPIIFVGLPNTGNAAWKISPMYPDGTYILSLNAYGSVPVTEEISDESAEFAISHPKVSADLYPLYPSADWQAATAESFAVGTASFSGASIASAPIPAGMNPGAIFTPFENYYSKKLKALGWKVADDLAAGGHVGGQTRYRKGDEVILTRFGINYQTRPENAPSECPCDVTLSLFSSEPRP